MEHEQFGSLFPSDILDGYEMENLAIFNDIVLIANFYNSEIEDEMTIRIAAKEWFETQENDLQLNAVMYQERNTGTSSYIHFESDECMVQYSFSKTDLAQNEQFYDMVYSASYFGECAELPDREADE